MSTVNPNRQRLMGPLDYLAAMAGASPPPQEPVSPFDGMMDAPFTVNPGPGLPMPFVDQPMNPYAPEIPMEVEQARRRMGM